MIADVEGFRGTVYRRERALSQASIKRAFDFVAASAILLFVLPVFIALMAAVACQFDGGPIFFSQRRIGRGGRSFKCLKFRSMCVDADRVLERILEQDLAAHEEWLATGKLRQDKRITEVGRILRTTSLDELPQLWKRSARRYEPCWTSPPSPRGSWKARTHCLADGPNTSL